MHDYLVSQIRTWLPLGWGLLLSWLGSHQLVDQAVLDSVPPSTAGWLTAVVTGLFYSLVRWVEPKLPTFLRFILLGSDKQPTYSKPDTG